jgi:hypothetical protein
MDSLDQNLQGLLTGLPGLPEAQVLEIISAGGQTTPARPLDRCTTSYALSLARIYWRVQRASCREVVIAILFC